MYSIYVIKSEKSLNQLKILIYFHFNLLLAAQFIGTLGGRLKIC